MHCRAKPPFTVRQRSSTSSLTSSCYPDGVPRRSGRRRSRRSETRAACPLVRAAPRTVRHRKEAIMDVVLLGPPGAGKGTQAVALAACLGLCHVSSGDLFRQTVASGGELGRRIAAIMERGDLVPDEITVRMVVDRLGRPVCAGGAILDGFPRTVEQSEALERELRLLDRRLGAAILIDVPEETLVRRLSGRWISRKTGRVVQVATVGQRRDHHADGRC